MDTTGGMASVFTAWQFYKIFTRFMTNYAMGVH